MQLNINKEKKELKTHGDYAFPVNISEEILSHYEGGTFLWHWHPEIELTYIVDGQIEYNINEKSYILKKGDGVFGNSNTMHSGKMVENKDCTYLSVTFHPRFIYGFENSLIQTKYVNFILGNHRISSLKLTDDVDWQRDILNFLNTLYKEVVLNKKEFDELIIHIEFSKFWLNIYKYFSSLPDTGKRNENNISRIKDILTYIHHNYSEPLTLDDIANNVNLCKSECCRFFKKNMKITLFDYLLFYRIQQSLPMLTDNDNISITEISEKCGFSNSCYYGKIFKRYMKCTPSEYRKNRRNT